MRQIRDLEMPRNVSSDATSIPLILPNDLAYDTSTNSVQRRKGVERTELMVVPEGITLLSKIRGPVAVISISGLARTGKSYILSRLLGKGDTFSLGHTMDPHTFGIWIGTKALIKDGLTVLLLDTEGISAFAAEKRNDVSLLALTLLLSSTFIFNTQSVPKQGQLEDLQCFVQIAEAIRVKESGQHDHNLFRKVLPDFLWLLRDVHLMMTNEHGQEITPRSYMMDRVLKRSNSFSETASDKVARAIRSFFPSFDCKCLPSPTEDPNTLNNIAANEDKLTVEFNDGVNEVTEKIWSMVKPKLSYDTEREMTGTQLAVLVETYTEALNDPQAVPVIQSSLQESIQIVEDKALAAAFEIYERGMSKGICNSDTPLEEGTVEDADDSLTVHGLHKRTYKEAEAELRQILTPLGGELAVNKALMKFRTEVTGTGNTGGKFAGYVMKNNDNSKAFCQNWLTAHYSIIQRNLEREGYTYTQLRQELKALQTNFRQQAKGPASNEAYRDFVKREEPQWALLASKEKYDAQRLEEERKSELLKSEIYLMDLEAARMQNQLYEQMHYQTQELDKLKDEYENAMKQAKEEEREHIERDFREQIQAMNRVCYTRMQSAQKQAQQNINSLAQHMTRVQSQQFAQRNHIIEIVEVVKQRNTQIAQRAADAVEKSRSFGIGSIVKLIGKSMSVAGAVIGFVRPVIGIGLEIAGDVVCGIGESMEQTSV